MHRTFCLLVSLLIFPSFAFAANAVPAQKEWTFLVFLNGHNNLSPYGEMNLNQMETVGSSDQVNIVVQWAAEGNSSTTRLLVQKDSNFRKVTSPIVQDLGDVDMGDYKMLREFVLWGMAKYPAKHYFVTVWDHGSGWHSPDARRQKMHPNDISWDDNTGNFITTKQLGQAMQEVAAALGRKVDIYGSDACLMQMAEIAGEMNGAVDYYVGSQEVEPAEGWPYDKFLAPLIANPLLSPRELSIGLTDQYAALYSNGGTFSVFDMSKYSALVSAVTELGAAIAALPQSELTKVNSAARGAFSFALDDYGDLGDFLTQLNAQGKIFASDKVVQRMQSAASAFVIHNAFTNDYSRATGISIWLPKSAQSYKTYSSLYKTMNFDLSAHWSEAISAYSR